MKTFTPKKTEKIQINKNVLNCRKMKGMNKKGLVFVVHLIVDFFPLKIH